MTVTRRVVVPGRVELVGKHVDYAGGRSLTCAVDRTITVAWLAAAEPVLVLHDARRTQEVRLPLTGDDGEGPRWRRYPRAVVRRLARDFGPLTTGAVLSLESSLPSAAGLSSSSALLIGVLHAVADANALPARDDWRALLADPLALAEYAGAIESGGAWGPFAGDDGVGTRGGAQDHVAILGGAAGMVGCFAYRPARLERRVPWPTGWSLVVAVSGVVASKTGNARAAYNRASDAARRLVDAWNARVEWGASAPVASLAQLLDAPAATAAALAALAAAAADDTHRAGALSARLAQFREETREVVPAATDALAAGDVAAFGRAVARSQQMAEEALGNQVPETIALVRHARELGSPAASAFGAGFGGSVWAMVRTDDVARFRAAWRARYREAFPRRAARMAILVTAPAGPARREDG